MKINLQPTNPIVILSAALVMTVTLAIGATGWTEGVNIVTFVGLGSIIISLMLVRSILPGLVAHQMSLIIGLGWSFWITSRLLPANYTWLERWENLISRLQYWYYQATQGGTSYDNLMFIFQMNVIIWGMGYMTIWLILRSGRVWQAIIPGGLVLLINLYYAPQDISLWFLIYLLLALLLVIRFNLFEQETRWRLEGTFFRSDISLDFLRDGFIFSALVIALAWFTPPVVDAKTLSLFDEFQGSWQDMQREWNRMYADLNYANPSTLNSFGTNLTLGGPRNLTKEPVMEVQIEGIGRYWRATTYDEYTGLGWRNNDEEAASFGPETPLTLPQYDGRVPVTQTYTSYRDGSTILYGLSQVVQIDRPARVSFNELSVEYVAGRTTAPIWLSETQPWVEEITYLRSNAVVDRGETYQVVSMVTQASVPQLEAAGEAYPPWVTERYLQLPTNITPRTRDLATTLTERFSTPFAKTRAIERYLRTELTYNEKMAQPPAGVEKVDYVLFESQEAYCDYYASAMVVMLRSLGIPSRIAVGFARGQYDGDKRAFQVVNADAHSWVEVYFPRYGWVEFEPTSAQPVIIRPVADEESGPVSGSNPNDGLPERDDFGDRPNNMPIDEEAMAPPASSFFTLNLPWLWGTVNISWPMVQLGGLVIGLLLMASLAGAVFWWQHQDTAETIFTLYQRLLRWAGWLGLGIRPWQTPFEHTAMLQHHLPDHRADLETITAEYVRRAFRQPAGSDHNGASVSSAESSLAWQRLRPALLWAVWHRFWPW